MPKAAFCSRDDKNNLISVMKSTVLFLFSGCCTLHLLIPCTTLSTADRCNYELSQCRDSGGPGQSLASGMVTCITDGSLSVSIYIRANDDDIWNWSNGITVLYTCWSQLGNVQVRNGVVWNNTSVYPGNWLNRTVNVMHHGAMCRVYSCYSPDECNYYSITMVSTDCNFKPAHTSITSSVPMQILERYLNTNGNNLIVSTPILAVSSTYEHHTSSVQPLTSIATTLFSRGKMVTSSTGVTMKETTNGNGLAVILPMMLVLAGGVVALIIILLCYIGYRYHHKLNTNKLYRCDEVFDPYFNPIDISAGVKVAQSIYSIYDSARNENNKSQCDYETEDEKSEILVSVAPGDDVRSNASIIISEEDKLNRDCNEYTRRSDPVTLNSAPSPSTIRSFSHSSDSSGYVTQNMSQASFQPSETIILLHENQVVCSQEKYTEIKTQTSHINRQETVHKLQSSEIVNATYPYGLKEGINGQLVCHERYRDMNRSLIGTKYKSSSVRTDGGKKVIQPSTPTGNNPDKDTYVDHDLLTISDDVLPECSLSLNPSHFEPIDSYT